MVESFVLYTGEKNISSWSMRAFVSLVHKGVSFEERTIPLVDDKDRRLRRQVSPTGKVPVLHHGTRVIPDSLAILAYLEEVLPSPRYPALWPSDLGDRAYARWLAAAMVIAKNVVLGDGVTIHPFAVIEDDARIGSRVTLNPGVYVGQGSRIGDDTVVYPNVSIREGVAIGNRVIIHSGTVIGSDGFGFVTENGIHHKIMQVGGVIIEDDVEIGANCAIDRAAMGNTVIRKGTKIDNQVHIAHNVQIGEHCLLAGQAGIAGSTVLGNYVVVGGRTAISLR